MSTIDKSNSDRSTIGYIIGTTRRLILKVLGAEFVRHQIPLSIEQYIFLVTVNNLKGEATQQELANHTCKDKSAILRTIDYLEEHELVKRVPVEGDRRKNTIQVTPKCDQLFERIHELQKVLFGELTSGVSQEEFEITVKVLLQLQQNINTFSSTHK